jgi:hypothetical protein
MSLSQVSGNTTQNCFNHGKCWKETDETGDILPFDMTVRDFQAWMAIDWDFKDAAKLKENDISETVLYTSA